MSTFTTTQNANPLQYLMSGLFALLLLAATAVPAQAQMDDGELPSIDFSVNLAQHAQILQASARSGDDPDANAGFPLVRAGLISSVQFSENVSGLLMLEQEPNDFGGQFSPAVDFAILNLQVSDGLTVQAGTPVTGLLNFRGFSDGPAVQGNPLIGNSPADMITAGQGVKLIGSFDGFGFDFTINKGFGGTLTGFNGENTGVNLIGKVRITGSETFQVGGGFGVGTGDSPLRWAGGDGENYHINPSGSIAAVRNTHASIPGGGSIFQADAKIMAGGADVDLWGGFATQSDPDRSGAFGGLGIKFDVSDSFYLAGRFTAVNDQTDYENDLDTSTLTRIQAGIGVQLYDNALFKIEGVTQSEGDSGSVADASAPGEGFTGVVTELSFNF